MSTLGAARVKGFGLMVFYESFMVLFLSFVVVAHFDEWQPALQREVFEYRPPAKARLVGRSRKR